MQLIDRFDRVNMYYVYVQKIHMCQWSRYEYGGTLLPHIRPKESALILQLIW